MAMSKKEKRTKARVAAEAEKKARKAERDKKKGLVTAKGATATKRG